MGLARVQRDVLEEYANKMFYVAEKMAIEWSSRATGFVCLKEMLFLRGFTSSLPQRTIVKGPYMFIQAFNELSLKLMDCASQYWRYFLHKETNEQTPSYLT